MEAADFILTANLLCYRRKGPVSVPTHLRDLHSSELFRTLLKALRPHLNTSIDMHTWPIDGTLTGCKPRESA